MPTFFTFEKKNNLNDNSFIHFYFDLGKKEKIKKLNYQFKGLEIWKNELDNLCAYAIDKTLSELRALTTTQLSDKEYFIHLPLYLLQFALDEYTSNHLTHAQLHQKKSSELLCPCFGVYRSQIIDYLKEHPQTNILKLTEVFKITGACGHCEIDVDELILAYAIEKKTMPFNGLLPVEFVLKAHDLLTEHFDEKNFEIIDFKNSTLKIRSNLNHIVLNDILQKEFGNELIVLVL